jgi:purine-binding chemotaxis protein CheW
MIGSQQMLLCRVGTVVCGLRVENVVETLRPLPIESINGAPDFVSGVSVIRGAPVPVVDLPMMLGGGDARPGRFVVVKLGARRIALWVAEVIGLRTLEPDSLEALPPLLDTSRSEFISALGSLDAQLLVVLEGARILPESAWAALRGGGAEA